MNSCLEQVPGDKGIGLALSLGRSLSVVPTARLRAGRLAHHSRRSAAFAKHDLQTTIGARPACNTSSCYLQLPSDMHAACSSAPEFKRYDNDALECRSSA